MKKIISCLMVGRVILISGISNLVFAQSPITLTRDDAPSELGTYFVMGTADTVAVNLGEPGENKYWDFSKITLTGEDYWRVVDFNTSPFADRFTSLNGNLTYQVSEYVKDTTFITYNYVRLIDTELTQLGRGIYKIMGNDTTIKEIIVAKRSKPQLNLPVEFGNPKWDSVIEFDSVFNFVFVKVEATVKDSNRNQIDAWGTIKTAFGEFPCLRIRQDHSIFARAKDYPGLKLAIEININYYWVTNDFGIIATVTGMSDPQNKPIPDSIYSTAKSVNIMTNFFPTSIKNITSGAVPLEFELFQNFPNPFNPRTTIRYQLKEPAEVKLRVFNIAGQEIALLARARQNPGRYEIEWNAGDLPSGVYYYQINANQNVVTKKCLLLK
jgi:hypothetical protein